VQRPTKSVMLNVKMSSTGYQEPSTAECTFSAAAEGVQHRGRQQGHSV
jgi:hypothetical protein